MHYERENFFVPFWCTNMAAGNQQKHLEFTFSINALSFHSRTSIYRKSEHQMFLLISGSHAGAAKRYTNMVSPVPGDIHSSTYREKNDLVVVLACYITQAWKSKGLIVTVMPLLNTWRWNCTLHQQLLELQLFTALLRQKLINFCPVLSRFQRSAWTLLSFLW